MTPEHRLAAAVSVEDVRAIMQGLIRKATLKRCVESGVKNIGVFETIGTPKHPRLARRSLAATGIRL